MVESCLKALICLVQALKQVILVDNVTVAVSMVLQRIVWGFFEGHYQKGDAVLAMNFSYGAVKAAVKAYLVRAGAHLVEVKLPFPVRSMEAILAAFESTLNRAQMESRRIRFAIIDHITSMPTMILPVQELVKMCRKAGVGQIFVDGAHTIGSININVQEIDADYYAGNLHKWLFTPTSVAFMCCKLDRLSDLHHPIVSHDYQNGLSKECAWVGTRDYSAQLTIVDAINFFNKFKGGLQAIQCHNHSRVVAMGEMLAKAWNTHLGTPPELCSSMVMVGLPNALGVHSNDNALDLRTRLRQEFGVEVPVFYAADAAALIGRLELSDNCKEIAPLTAYVRISHQIYNRLEDYVKLRDAVKSIVKCA